MPDVGACLLCDRDRAERELNRTTVWEDGLWRLSMPRRGYTTGFGYLEPRRHVPYITDLDGEEAATFGPTIARVTGALKAAADAELVYVYVFGGGIPHLHLHLVPHRSGDALNERIIRGELTEERQPNGTTRMLSQEFAYLPSDAIEVVIDRARSLLLS